VVVTDWYSIGQLINQGFATDIREGLKLSINAGIDIDMSLTPHGSSCAFGARGEVSQDRVDESVRRILV